MSISPKTAPRSYRRMGLVVVLIACALVALLVLSGTDPTREWRIDPSIMNRLRFPPRPVADPAPMDSVEADPFAPEEPETPLTDAEWHGWRSQVPLRDLLEKQGIRFWNAETIEFDPASSVLTITSAAASLDATAELFTQLAIEESKARAGF